MPQFNTYVFVIESPAPSDLYDGRTEGRGLKEALRLGGIPRQYRLVTDLEHFKRALGTKLGSDIYSRYEQTQQVPIIHLSMHGNDEGVGLTDGTHITWQELYQLLQPINDGLNGALIVCLSSCSGYAATRMSMHNGRPIGAIASYYSELEWDVGLLGFSTFYFNLFKGAGIEVIRSRMQAATGDDGFAIETGEFTKASYLKFLEKQALDAMTSPEGPAPYPFGILNSGG